MSNQPVKPSGRDAQQHSIQCVDRTVSVLEALAREGALGVTAIAAELGVHKSTASRLLTTLESRGLVEHSFKGDRYRLGHGMIQLSRAAVHTYPLSAISRPVCRALAQTVGETVDVSVNDGLGVVSIDQVIGSASLTAVASLGRREPMHATAAGKVFLAHMSPSELAGTLARGLKSFTDHTLVDVNDVKSELAGVLDQGYAQSVDEHEVGLLGIASPIHGADGQVVAALTVSGPTFRIGRHAVPQVAGHLFAAAAEISQRNGHRKSG